MFCFTLIQWNQKRHEPVSFKEFHFDNLNGVINFLQDYLSYAGYATQVCISSPLFGQLVPFPPL